MPNKVLVTGATGFIGGRLVRALVEAGEQVRILARPGSVGRSLRDLLPHIEVCDGNILVEHTVFRALAGCDRLYHCAAVYALWASDPKTIMDGAVEGTRAVLSAARARGIERVVYTSSVATIGASMEPVAMDEDTPWVEPGGPVYTVAKRRAEEFALEYAREKRLPVITVNPAGVMGPGDYKPTPSGQATLQVLRAPVIPGLGTLVPRAPGGLSVVDVDDVAKGHLLAMEKGRDGERYILGGENISMSRIFETVAELVGKPAPKLNAGRVSALAAGALMSLGARFTGETPPISWDAVKHSFGVYYFVSSAKAERELGYTHRPARQTLARGVRFYLDHGYIPAAEARRLRLDPTAMSAA